jgi:ubiquinone/menaquinone biosynthesis C-methylase UbiE
VTSAAARKPQLAYSEFQAEMLDEQKRRTKARKIVGVLHHFLGRPSLQGLSALDIGCSAGFIADELAADGAGAVGIDIDVPGITAAKERFGDRVAFVCTTGDTMPFPDESFDVVIFNHIYEHVVDPDAVMSEIHRVLKPTGVAYLGLGQKYQLVEPHYKLPLLSWLPRSWGDRYVRATGKADEYYELYRSRRGLREMVSGFHVWDYTVAVIRRPDLFFSQDQVTAAARLSPAVVHAMLPIVPTYIWVATKAGSGPATPEAADLVEHLDLTDN